MIVLEPDGQVTFKVFLPHASTVELVGDFTDWQRRRFTLKRVYPGWWTATIPVPAGEHRFGYLVDGAIQIVDYGAHGVSLDGDRWVSRLLVGTAIPTEADVTPRVAPVGAGSPTLTGPRLSVA